MCVCVWTRRSRSRGRRPVVDGSAKGGVCLVVNTASVKGGGGGFLDCLLLKQDSAPWN